MDALPAVSLPTDKIALTLNLSGSQMVDVGWWMVANTVVIEIVSGFSRPYSWPPNGFATAQLRLNEPRNGDPPFGS